MSKLQKATEELNSMIKGKNKEDARGAVSKAYSSLKSAMSLLKGVDLDAKDYESSDLDAYDTRPRGHRGARQRNDAGNGYSGMERTPREDEDFESNRNEHRVIVTGKPQVNEGHSEDEDFENPEDADFGDDEFYSRTKMGKKNSDWRDRHYKSENEEDEDEDGDEKEDKKKKGFMKDHEKSDRIDHDLVKSEEDIYDELLASPEFTEVVEATPAVAHIADVMGKSFGEVFEDMYILKSAMASLIEANAQLLKMAQGVPVNSSAPGIVGKVGETHVNLAGMIPNINSNQSAPTMSKGNMSTASATDRLWHAETLRKLEDATNAGHITPEAFGKAASMLDSVGSEALKSIPANVRKQYSLE